MTLDMRVDLTMCDFRLNYSALCFHVHTRKVAQALHQIVWYDLRVGSFDFCLSADASQNHQACDSTSRRKVDVSVQPVTDENGLGAVELLRCENCVEHVLMGFTDDGRFAFSSEEKRSREGASSRPWSALRRKRGIVIGQDEVTSPALLACFNRSFCTRTREMLVRFG